MARAAEGAARRQRPEPRLGRRRRAGRISRISPERSRKPTANSPSHFFPVLILWAAPLTGAAFAIWRTEAGSSRLSSQSLRALLSASSAAESDAYGPPPDLDAEK